jgi:hypothetical protein
VTNGLFVCVALTVVLYPAVVTAHDGPPYPILSDHVQGPYRLSIWTDPDTTDDGSPGGQFWVTIEMATSARLPSQTHAALVIAPLDRSGPERRAAVTPVDGRITNQLALLLMDHEGRFAVRLTVDGPAGHAVVNREVQATYDLRPPAFLLFVYVVPFVLVGLLWARVIVSRRPRRSPGGGADTTSEARSRPGRGRR